MIDRLKVWSDQEEVLARAKNVAMLILDVDGVMTDGGIIINDLGVESKRFDVRDGHGLKMLLRAGIDVALITGRESQVVAKRAEELGINWVFQGIKNKLPCYEQLLAEKGLKSDQVGYVGDDVVDIPVLKRVGLAVAVPGAHEVVAQYAHYITQAREGNGAVREVCELLLYARDLWQEAMSRYTEA
ncbi:MAG: HAD-IIIA family hydrolase [Deltaproteobacteria bacterium]|nr:HAD-IIIA family hydrolase [Deltaproteobacteria bacterium]